MQFESEFELGDEIYYYDAEGSNKIIKAKIIYIDAWSKSFDRISSLPVKHIEYIIEFNENGKVRTHSSISEWKLMTKEKAEVLYETLMRVEKEDLFGEEEPIKLGDHWTKGEIKP
jgi:hypothetical protein